MQDGHLADAVATPVLRLLPPSYLAQLLLLPVCVLAPPVNTPAAARAAAMHHGAARTTAAEQCAVPCAAAGVQCVVLCACMPHSLACFLLLAQLLNFVSWNVLLPSRLPHEALLLLEEQALSHMSRAARGNPRAHAALPAGMLCASQHAVCQPAYCVPAGMLCARCKAATMRTASLMPACCAAHTTAFLHCAGLPAARQRLGARLQPMGGRTRHEQHERLGQPKAHGAGAAASAGRGLGCPGPAGQPAGGNRATAALRSGTQMEGLCDGVCGAQGARQYGCGGGGVCLAGLSSGS